MGLINVVEPFLCKYPEFSVCLERVQRPENTAVLRSKGVGVTDNLNHGVRYVFEKEHQWVWMLDDKCIFSDDLLNNLLGRDVDIVVPFGVSDVFPHLPELYETDCSMIDNMWLKEQSGLVETRKLATFHGMLVKRSVFEVIHEPWFANMGLMPDRLGGDIWFCKQALDAGFTIHVDFENTIGRVCHFSMWPSRNGEQWGVGIDKPVPWEDS